MKKFFSVASLAVILCFGGVINGQIAKIPTEPDVNTTSVSQEQLQQLEATVEKPEHIA